MQGYYRSIIRSALEITWRYKFLWFFGIFAAFTGNGEEYDILVRNFNTVEDMQMNLELLGKLKDNGQLAIGWNNITAYLSENLLSVFLLVLVIIAIFFLVVWLITVSQASIIAAAARHDKKKKADFLDLMWSGHQYFWRIFVVNVYAKLLLFGTLIVLGTPLAIAFVNTRNLGYAITLSLLTFLILVPLNIIFSFLTKFAAAFIVTKGYTANDAFFASIKLFFQNWLVSLELALLLFLINFGVSFTIIGLLTYAGLPFSQVGFIFFTFAIVFMGAVLATFQFSSWTFLFNRLVEGKSYSKITRWFAARGWAPSPEAAAKNTKL